MSTLSRTELNVLVEQMMYIWSGRTVYKDDTAWLDRVDAIINEVVKACDLEPIKMETMPNEMEEMSKRLDRISHLKRSSQSIVERKIINDI
tara:strand:+ start:4286 stop:4558 length:273 start_codon:yes stop_codon:yes gene_type:complete